MHDRCRGGLPRNVRDYQDRGIDHFLFTIPQVADSDYLHVIGRDILPTLT